MRAGHIRDFTFFVKKILFGAHGLWVVNEPQQCELIIIIFAVVPCGPATDDYRLHAAADAAAAAAVEVINFVRFICRGGAEKKRWLLAIGYCRLRSIGEYVSAEYNL